MAGPSHLCRREPTERQAARRRRKRSARTARCSPSTASSSSSETPSTSSIRRSRLQRLQQRASARAAVAQQRAELLVDERVQLGRVAQVVQQIGHARPPRVVPAGGSERRRRTGRAAHAAQPLARGVPGLDRGADRERRVLDAQPAAPEHASEEVGEVLGQRRVVLARAERDEHEQVHVTGAEQDARAQRRQRRPQLAR
jgi:hypothetical protein